MEQLLQLTVRRCLKNQSPSVIYCDVPSAVPAVVAAIKAGFSSKY